MSQTPKSWPEWRQRFDAVADGLSQKVQEVRSPAGPSLVLCDDSACDISRHLDNEHLLPELELEPLSAQDIEDFPSLIPVSEQESGDSARPLPGRSEDPALESRSASPHTLPHEAACWAFRAAFQRPSQHLERRLAYRMTTMRWFNPAALGRAFQ